MLEDTQRTERAKGKIPRPLVSAQRNIVGNLPRSTPGHGAELLRPLTLEQMRAQVLQFFVPISHQSLPKLKSGLPLAEPFQRRFTILSPV